MEVKCLFVTLLFYFVFAKNAILAQSSRCGEVLSSSNGSILYKTEAPLDVDERCVWTIRTANATHYDFRINLGFVQSPDRQLTITGFGYYNQSQQLIPLRSGSYSMNEISVVVVTMYTTGYLANSTFGFSLEFSGADWGGRKASQNSKDYFLRVPNGTIRHPEGGNYDNFEITTLVVAPPDNEWIRKGWQTSVTFSVIQLEYCYDHLRIYKYNPHLEQKWKIYATICNSTETTTVETDEILVVIFETDETRVYDGIQLSFESTNGSDVKKNEIRL